MTKIVYNAADTQTAIDYLLGQGACAVDVNTILFEHGAALYREMALAIRENALTRKALIAMLDRRLAQRGYGAMAYNPTEVYRAVFGPKR